jgi:hypothetical protein
VRDTSWPAHARSCRPCRPNRPIAGWS